MDYKKRIYSKYVSTHTLQFYNEEYLNVFKKQFSVWQSYFGRFLPEDKNARIIDLGCGNGGFVFWLQESGYKNVEGIDISDEQVEVAQKLGIKNIQQVDIKEFLKDKKEVYDMILMRDVLEHFNKEEILDILDIIYKSLKQKGLFVCQTINGENLLAGRLRYIDFTHELAFTKESISQILRISGFKDIKVYPQPPVIHGVKSFIRYILWKFIEYCLHFYLLVGTGSAKGIFTQDIIILASK